MPRSLALATLAVSALVGAAPAHADEARDPDDNISIAELVQLAVRQSPALVLVRSQVQLAKLDVIVAGAAAQWRIDASAGVAAKRNETQVTGSAGVGKQLPTGGDLALSLRSTEEMHAADPAAAMTGSNTAGIAELTLDLRQPILRGLGQGARIDQKKAALVADATTLQTRDASAATIRDLIAAYWELAYARANVSVSKQSLGLAQKQLDVTKKMHDRGTLPDSAVQAARYGVALREEARLRAVDAVQSASLELRRLSGMEIGIELGDLAPTDPLVVPTENLDLEDTIQTALARSPRIAAAKLGVAIADVELRRKKNLSLPALDLGASAGMVGVGPDRAASFEALGDPEFQVSGTLALRYEIGGAASAAEKAARIEKSNAKVSAKDVEREVITAVIDVVRRVSAARKRAVVAQSAIQLATSNLETELSLFRFDKSTNVLVFERQQELDEALLLASRAAADYQIAITTLDYLTGHLLERHGVEVVHTRKGSRK